MGDLDGEVPWVFFEHSESKKLFAENVSEKDAHGWTALYHAAYENLPEVAKALIEAKVDVNAECTSGWTALHGAARNNCLEIGRMLIDADANVNAKDSCQYTPLDVAKWKKHLKFAEMLLKKI